MLTFIFLQGEETEAQRDIHRKGHTGREITILKYNIIYYIIYRCLILLVDKLRVFLLA